MTRSVVVREATELAGRAPAEEAAEFTGVLLGTPSAAVPPPFVEDADAIQEEERSAGDGTRRKGARLKKSFPTDFCERERGADAERRV